MPLNIASLPQNQLISFCQALVKKPSINGIHQEQGVAKLVAEFAVNHGLDMEIVERESGRPNVLISVGPSIKNGLLLVSHMDTVGIGDIQNWHYSPFGGEIADDRIYGRGAADNKGGLVAAMGALLSLRDEPKLKRRVTLLCVSDEESGATGELGVKYLHCMNKLSAQGAIYTYPGMDCIKIGHRGVLRVKIVTHGKTFHTGSTFWQNHQSPSYNAITGMAQILLDIESLEVMAKPEEGFFERFRTVLTPTTIRGGVGPSLTPDRCEAIVDIRVVPSYPQDIIYNRIAEIIEKVQTDRLGLEVDLLTETSIPPTIIPEDSPLVFALRTIATDVLGETPKLVVSGPANESYLFNNFGIPTCVYGPEGDGCHSVDEFVEISSIFLAAEVFAKTALVF